MFVSGRCVCVCEAIRAPSVLKFLRRAVALARMLPTLKPRVHLGFRERKKKMLQECWSEV